MSLISFSRLRPLLTTLALLALTAAGCSAPTAVPTTNGSAALGAVTPQPGTGQVVGRLTAKTPDGPPYIGGDLYLGSLLPIDNLPDAGPVVAFSADIEPRAQYDPASGSFVFANVKPGKYALLIYDPYNTVIIPGPDQGLLTVTVLADATVDLQTVVVP